MSGNYGNLWLNVWNTEIANTAFVTIAAASGQTPVLTSIFIAGTKEWAFNGLKVQSLQGAAIGGYWLVDIDDYSPTFPTSDIVLQNMTISSQDNVARRAQVRREGYWRRERGRRGGRHPRLHARGALHRRSLCIPLVK
ncbi:MAG TPA: hypothetical protein VGG77_10750 [Roseiarcus sp.]|jgi:hypothetical protein